MKWPAIAAAARLGARLARGRDGNTTMLVAAGLAPLLALVGGAIDMSRSYLTETRLQQACDAGVLAARKAMGAQIATDGEVPDAVGETGNRFFNLNFREGSYGTDHRDFFMTLESNYAISGAAQADVPATIMRLFGYDRIPVRVSCQAQLSFSNTDVMMVLDVTGSMNETNPGDSAPKIALLQDVVRSFHAQLEATRHADARIRFGFVPYSTNVNVGGVLEDDWVVDQWTYQSRELSGAGTAMGTFSYSTAMSPVSGGISRGTHSTYPAVFSMGRYTCPTLPVNTLAVTYQLVNTTSTAVTTPVPGTRTVQTYHATYNGNQYSAALAGTTCTVTRTSYSNYIYTYDHITEPALTTASRWEYKPVTRDVSNWRAETEGCVEERETYEIQDFDNVDLDRAPDLDLDLVPDPADPDTQWRPMYPELIFARSLRWNGTGGFNPGHAMTTDEFLAPALARTDACPNPAQKLREMSAAELDAYLASLKVGGSTYHDTGMIWGGRLISPTGLFAAENADVSEDRPTSRHLIFLTDGQTSTLDISYSAYGMEPLDRRRWQPASQLSLTETVERRLAFACEEVKRRNVTVWLVAFGTDLNSTMTQCAGPGRAFQASDGDELSQAFIQIANAMSNLRITR